MDKSLYNINSLFYQLYNKLNNYNKELFKKAVYVNVINRIVEHDSKRIRKLLDELDNNKWA